MIGESSSGYLDGGGPPPPDLFFGQSDPITTPFLDSSFPRCSAERGGILIFRGGLAGRIPRGFPTGPDDKLTSVLSSGREDCSELSPWSDNTRLFSRPRGRWLSNSGGVSYGAGPPHESVAVIEVLFHPQFREPPSSNIPLYCTLLGAVTRGRCVLSWCLLRGKDSRCGRVGGSGRSQESGSCCLVLGERECSEETPRDGRRSAGSSCLASRNGVCCVSREGIGDEGRTGVAASFFVGSGSIVEAASEVLIGSGGTGSVSPGIGTGETFPRDEAVDDTGDLCRDMSALSQYAFSDPIAGVPHVG